VTSNSLDCTKVAERCYDEGLFLPAKIIFSVVKNNARISSCLVQLKDFEAAIEAAKKAGTPKTWKEVCMACIEMGEYKMAALAGMNIIIHPDHLEDLIQQYLEFGQSGEVITLLEAGIGLERAHIGIFTELAILYAKYLPSKLNQHI